MKTIKIQKDAKLNDSIYVLVNGEKYFMRHQSLQVNVADDKPFEVRVKNLSDGSPSYTFEPKDDTVLQISKNRRLVQLVRFLVIAAMAFVFVIHWIFEFKNKTVMLIYVFSIILFNGIFHIFRWKRFFAIREVIKNVV